MVQILVQTNNITKPVPQKLYGKYETEIKENKENSNDMPNTIQASTLLSVVCR